MLDAKEEINKINLYQSLNQTQLSINGIQFYTTKQRKSPIFGSNDGRLVSESFENYTFGYAKGKQTKTQGIETLQFIWIRQCSIYEQIVIGRSCYNNEKQK